MRQIILPGTPALCEYGRTLQVTKALAGLLPVFTSSSQFPDSPALTLNEIFPLGRGSPNGCTKETLLHPSDNKKWPVLLLIRPGFPHHPSPTPIFFLPHFFRIGVLPGHPWPVCCPLLHLQFACIRPLCV